MSRGQAGRGLVVLLAAAIIAVVASAATYGIADRAGRHPVVLTNTGRGPAAVLHNRPAYPPLAVTSSRKVAHLNADSVDGLGAADLEPAALHWTFGKDGDALAIYEQITVPPGWYAVNGHVAVHSTDGDPHAPGCYVFPQGQGNGGDFTNVVSAQAPATLQTYVSVSGVIRIPRGDRMELACQVDSGGPMDITAPATFVARPIHLVDGPPAVDIGPERPGAASTARGPLR